MENPGVLQVSSSSVVWWYRNSSRQSFSCAWKSYAVTAPMTNIPVWTWISLILFCRMRTVRKKADLSRIRNKRNDR